MALFFIMLSSGYSLLVTFIPGLLFAWLVFFTLYYKKINIPKGSNFVPVYFIALAVQFLHFTEEYYFQFYNKFPVLYHGSPYSVGLFVAFNMLSYSIFTIACILVFYKNIKFLLMPVLFFIVYGVLGNAISHTLWSIYFLNYFPGLVTDQIYWILGPLLLYQFLHSKKYVLIIVFFLFMTLAISLAIFM